MEPWKWLSRRYLDDGAAGAGNCGSGKTTLVARWMAIRHVAAVEQIGADEGVEVAVEDLVDVAAFDLGAVVLDQLVGCIT